MLLRGYINKTWLVFLIAVPIVWFACLSFWNHAVRFGYKFALSKCPNPASNLKDSFSQLPPTATVFPPAATGERAVKKLLYPSDYLNQSKDDEWCKSWYSSQYLDYTASHHIEYCEDGSHSRLECFRTEANDPLCIARGVVLDISRTERGLSDTAIDCRLRNFTTESSRDSRAAAQFEGILNIADMQDYFHDTGVKGQMAPWDMTISVEGGASEVLCSAVNNDNKWTLLVKREMGENIWHRLMELWQAIITLDILQMAINAETQRPYLSPSDIPKVQVILEDDKVSLLEDWWTMVTGNVPLRKSNISASCLGTVILPFPGSSSPFWKGHWETHDCHDTFLLDTLTRRLYQHLAIQPPKPSKDKNITVTVVERKSTRKIFNLAKYVQRLQHRWPNANIQIVDFATKSLKDQVLLAFETDVLVGAMGSSLTHMLWLARSSSVVEFMAPNAQYYGFRNAAKWKGHHFFTTHGIDIEKLGQTHDDWVAKAKTAEKENHGSAQHEGVAKRDWQNDPWLYLEEDTFVAIVEAAIYAQLHKGEADGDVEAKTG